MLNDMTSRVSTAWGAERDVDDRGNDETAAGDPGSAGEDSGAATGTPRARSAETRTLRCKGPSLSSRDGVERTRNRVPGQ
jgi:hypothetical protein